MSTLDQHAEVVMARVRGVLGAHAPDLLLAFEGLILMDLLTEAKPKSEIPIASVDVPVAVELPRTNGVHEVEPEPRVDKPVEIKQPNMVWCANCGNTFQPDREDQSICADCMVKATEEAEEQLSQALHATRPTPPEVPPILERPVVPPRESAVAVVETVSVEGKSIEQLIANAPNLSSPHDPEKMVQLVRSMIDDPTGTNSGPFVSKFLCIPVQGTHWVLRWVRYHAEVLPNLKNYQKSEYLQKLLADRVKVKKEAP